MSLIDFFFSRKKHRTAQLAHDRLQIIIAQERGHSRAPDYIPTLKAELMQVLLKYVNVQADDVRITQERQDGTDVLELNITLPGHAPAHDLHNEWEH